MQIKEVISGGQVDIPSCFIPKTTILGFSKGGTVLDQIVTELGFADIGPNVSSAHDICIVPKTKETLLNSISEIHYVDVGLNSTGAYLTHHDIFERISKRLIQGARRLRFVLHVTPRQWTDEQRDWIQKEKDKMLLLLESEAGKSGGKLDFLSRYYFSDKLPNIEMHFEIIESLDVS